jgi:signal transduction histidine kinase
MRPILVFAPGGQIPDGIQRTLEEAGLETLVAQDAGEFSDLFARERPDAALLVPPDLSPAGAAAESGAGDAGSALLLSRLELSSLLALWEEILERQEDLSERALRLLSKFLDASRVSLFRWKPGDASATVVASSLGVVPVGRSVEIARYPELRAAASRSGAVLVEEVEKDPLMGDASAYLAGVPVRSLLCQRLPGSGSALYLHAVRDRTAFAPSDVALVVATVRLLQAIRDVRAPRGTGEKAERRRLRAVELLFRGIPEPTALVATSGEILLSNPPFLALTGRVASELTGLDYRNLLRAPHAEDDFEPLSESAGSEVVTRRARLALASGETIPVEVLSLPADDETYSQAGWSALTLRDLRSDHARRARELVLEKEVAASSRELATAERRTREADAARARFWAAAEHEIRTPLAIAESHLEVVLSDLADGIPEQTVSLLKKATGSVRRLERLVTDVLDVATAGRARIPAAPDDLDLPEVLKGLERELRDEAERRGCTLVFEAAPGPLSVRAERDRTERLLCNLVEHSLRASPPGGTVRVTVTRQSGRIEVTVLDAGPPLSRERVQELFQDAGAARGSAEFGLAVARRVADAVGAELWARTEPDGQNARVVAWPAGGR